MSPAVQALLTILGTLSIVAATIIFLREVGDILPPALAAGLAFVAGIGLLWLAFKPERIDHHGAKDEDRDRDGDGDEGRDGTGANRTGSSSYSSAAMARLQETIEPREEPPERQQP